MRKICCIKSKKYKKFVKLKISYICNKTLLRFGFLNKCGSEDQKYL